MLTPEEQAIVDFGAKQGKKSKEILGALSKFRAENKPIEVKPIFDAPVKPKSTLADVPSDIMEAGAGIKNIISTAGDRQRGILEGQASGEQGFLRTAGQTAANFASTVTGVAGEGLKLVAKLFSSPVAEDFYATAAKSAGQKVLSAPVAAGLIKKYEELKSSDPVAARDAVALEQGGEFLLNFLGLKAAEKIGDFTLKAGEKTLATGLKTGEQVVTKADDIIRQTDEVLTQEAKQALPPLPPDATPAMIRARAELEKPKMTLSEKWIGLQPDIKKQIAQNPEKLSQYIDVVKARNADVNLPTAYEIGGNEARRATAEMQKVLNETGGEIGQTRQRLGNIRYNQPQIKEIESTFLRELEKLNLTVKNGQVVQKAGALSRVGSANDIKVANDLYREFLKFKQNPNLTNGIDLRNAFDSKINFAKSAGEASTAIDPLSRQTRRVIADSSAQLVGKTEAKKLADYTQFMEAFNDIKSYTDRAAGGEYLLRLVLSGRGGEARQIIETIRKYTGINLMDDAVMMTTVTDMLGNQTQKTLFSQQVTSAGLDVAKILSGNPQGAIPLLTKFLQQKLVDTEGVLKGAAGIKPEPLKIPTVNEISDKLKGQRGFISAGYVDEGAITTKILSKLEGKQNVSRQFIEDLTNSGDVRQAERDLIRKTLEDFKGGDINVSEFANKVKTELLNSKTGLREGQPPIGSDWNEATQTRINLEETVARERFDIPNLEKVSFGGSDRDVYMLPNGNVLKVAKTSRGLTQNVSSADYYAEGAGLIPNTIEKGRNYLVKEFIGKPDANTKAMIAELKKLDVVSLNGKVGGFDVHQKEVQKAIDILNKYGYPGNDLMNYNPLWGDMTVIRNWGTKEGKPILLDEGTLNGDLVLKSANTKGSGLSSDPEFRDIYNQSRLARKKYGDTDRNTLYGETNVGVLQAGAAVAGTLAVAPLIAGAIQKVAQGLDARGEAVKIVKDQIGASTVMGSENFNEAVGIVKYLLQNGNAQELEKFISDQQIKMNE